ncbi:hypothetical protein BH11BAC7_BH11BAC7_30050 [soil metagenome]
MPRFLAVFLFLFIPFPSPSQETQKRILFRSDSTWYAADDQLLFSSNDKGVSWDTIFAKKSPADTVFFYGALDTATNVFISDAKTLFVFGWDGTMHYKTILFCSSDYGKTWNKHIFPGNSGSLGTKYLHKINADQFFLDCRKGDYYLTSDTGKTWIRHTMIKQKNTSADEHFTFHKNGDITFEYLEGKKRSRDGGNTWETISN